MRCVEETERKVRKKMLNIKKKTKSLHSSAIRYHQNTKSYSTERNTKINRNHIIIDPCRKSGRSERKGKTETGILTECDDEDGIEGCGAAPVGN